MGKFSPSKPSGPSASEIRAQEEARIKADNLKAAQESESKRARLRSRAFNESEEENTNRKQLLGQ